jgi:hypothetical protein
MVMPSGWGEGPPSLSAELARFAESVSCAHLTPLVARMSRPLGVAIVGRRGVGRRTVEAALRLHGVRVVAAEPDVRVLVIAEVFTPEDEALLMSDPGSTLIVLTKADVFGAARGGPLAAAARCAAEVGAVTGVAVVVMIGLLATVVDLDDELLGALRTLVTVPAELGSVDAFVAADHAVAGGVRARLLDRLDRFGIAHALLALADGAAPDAVVTRLRELSNVDGVLAELRRVAAPVGYQRVQHALAETRCLHARFGDDRLGEFLGSDAVAMAVMTAAVDVVEAAGLTVDRGDHPDAHARRAVQWSRYARGPVDALHRACAADITRGSLRLLDRVESGR